MNRIGRVVRGIAGSAVVWAVVVPIAYVVVQGVASMFGVASPPQRAWRGLFIGMAVRGALHGIVFGAILAFAGRRRTLATIGAVRVAAIGAVAGSVGPLISVGLILWNRGLHSGYFGSSPLFGAALPIVVGSAIGAVWASLALRIGRRGLDTTALTDDETVALTASAIDDSESRALPNGARDAGASYTVPTRAPIER